MWSGSGIGSVSARGPKSRPGSSRAVVEDLTTCRDRAEPRRESRGAEPEREGLAELVEPSDHRVVGDALLARLDDDRLALQLQDPELDEDGPPGVDVGVSNYWLGTVAPVDVRQVVLHPGARWAADSVRPDLQVARVTAEGPQRARPVHHRELRKGGEETHHTVCRGVGRDVPPSFQLARPRARQLVRLVHVEEHGTLRVGP